MICFCKILIWFCFKVVIWKGVDLLGVCRILMFCCIVELSELVLCIFLVGGNGKFVICVLGDKNFVVVFLN